MPYILPLKQQHEVQVNHQIDATAQIEIRDGITTLVNVLTKGAGADHIAEYTAEDDPHIHKGSDGLLRAGDIIPEVDA